MVRQDLTGFSGQREFWGGEGRSQRSYHEMQNKDRKYICEVNEHGVHIDECKWVN